MDKILGRDDIEIESCDLSLWYGDAQALKGVSIKMPENKVTAVIGPSGYGKSTFIRCINRMNDMIVNCRVTGSLLIEGKNIYDKDVDVVSLRERVGMVFQKPNQFPMSIYDNVAYGPRIQGINEKRELDQIIEDSLKVSVFRMR